MKAAVFKKKHEIHVEEHFKRTPAANEVTVRIKACGVCGTDLHIYEGSDGAAKVTPPLVLGHEFAGTIVEIGKDVKSLNVGDRVAVDPNDMCGECYFCRNGRGNFCENYTGIGTTVDGGFAEYVTVRAKQAYKIPDQLTFVEAAMTEPVSCCLNGADLAEIRAGDDVLIFGGGPIGLMMLQLAKLAGAASIVLVEPLAWKRELGRSLGADILIDPLKESIKDVLAANNIKNIMRSFECVGKRSTMEAAIEHAGKGAFVMLFGLTSPTEEIAVKPYDIFKKELTIRSSFINPYPFNRSIALLSSKRIRVQELITDVIPLDDINKVFEDDSYRKKGKIIIEA